jgi:hypothetical protein
MKSNKYIKFDGLNTDEVKQFLTNGKLQIEQIREGNTEKGIPHWFDFKIQFSYLGTQHELPLHCNDVIIEFEDAKHGKYYNIMTNETFEKSGKKYLHIK